MELCKAFYKTPLYWAVEKSNIDIIKLLLAKDNLNINILNIHANVFFTKFKIEFFNRIFQSNFNRIPNKRCDLHFSFSSKSKREQNR